MKVRAILDHHWQSCTPAVLHHDVVTHLLLHAAPSPIWARLLPRMWHGHYSERRRLTASMWGACAWQVRAHQHKACLILIIMVLMVLIGVVFYYGIVERHLRH